MISASKDFIVNSYVLIINLCIGSGASYECTRIIYLNGKTYIKQ